MGLTHAQRKKGTHLPSGLRRSIERHEKRHLRVARRLGGDGWWEFTEEGGGVFQRTGCDHLNWIEHAAISYAGNGGSWWAGSYCDKRDEANAKYYINQLPRKDRAEGRRQARKLARRLS